VIAANQTSDPPASTPDVKLVALDLDGTLLDSSKVIDDETVAALKAACARGVQVVIASARPPRGVRHIYQQLCLRTWQINYNGALIWDEGAGQAVFHRPMQPAVVRQIIDVARDQYDEVGVHAEVLDRWYTDRPVEAFVTETGRLFAPDGIVSVAEFCAVPITKLMFMGDVPMLMRLESLLLPRFGRHVTIVSTDSHLMQIMDARVSKAVALKKIAQHHGVKRESVMAVGDAPNDLGMLQYAGVAVAMENAHPVVKEEADWVAPSNDSRGVLAALKRFNLA
jgi:5-amino-6-(5-phospho-D-ribitylamino)uracil phosphatase